MVGGETVGDYDEIGVLRVFADTDGPEVRTWTNRLYGEYRDDATAIRDHAGRTA